MREGGAPLSAILRGQHATNGRTAAGYGRPSRAQQLAQDSLPSCGQQVRDRAAARAQSDIASRGPTTIVAPESRFRTCPTDHDSIGYPRMSASGESSTTMHRLLHASGSHPIPTPYDPKNIVRSIECWFDILTIQISPRLNLFPNRFYLIRTMPGLVTSASLPPAGSPVATHYSQPLAVGSIRNTQNAAFQLNKTTSLHFYDWFPKPAAGHSKLTHLLIQ
ncbi:hypothetical protein F511_10152 [Dorcoceras hygrometricum]|uniref:Uncharacterized protein n=1 Tax=Dorcoceras hygrometricum TaxID=472368 RepID=A0A2Z7AEP1_9LAMI|nr:hypothetical protein F511_10152 [Dorcoceras hygrometricum]